MPALLDRTTTDCELISGLVSAMGRDAAVDRLGVPGCRGLCGTKRPTFARRSRAAELGHVPALGEPRISQRREDSFRGSELFGGRPSLGVVGCMSRLLKTAKGQCAAGECRGPLEGASAGRRGSHSLADGWERVIGRFVGACVGRGPPLGMLRRGIGSEEAGCALRLGRAALGWADRVDSRADTCSGSGSCGGYGTKVCGCDRLRGSGA